MTDVKVASVELAVAVVVVDVRLVEPAKFYKMKCIHCCGSKENIHLL